jgi:hypothetical protein
MFFGWAAIVIGVLFFPGAISAAMDGNAIAAVIVGGIGAAFISYGVKRLKQPAPLPPVPWVCTACGTTGEPSVKLRGSDTVQAFMWCFFIVPGLFYRTWRRESQARSCARCGGAVVPVDSPTGRKLAGE